MQPQAGQRPAARKKTGSRPESWAHGAQLPQRFFFIVYSTSDKMIATRMSVHAAASDVLPQSRRMLGPSFVWLLPFTEETTDLYTFFSFMKKNMLSVTRISARDEDNA